MNAIRARFVKVSLSFALLSISHPLSAQISLVNLNGSVKDPSGSAIAAVRVVAKNLNTAATQESHTDSAGNFGLSLEPGAYELSITAEGFESRTALVTIAPSAAQSLSFTLAPELDSLSPEPASFIFRQARPVMSDFGFQILDFRF